VNDAQAGLIYSLGLHVTVVTVAWVGLPFLDSNRDDIPAPIIVEFVEVGEQTSAPPPKVEAVEKKEEPKPKEEQKFAAREDVRPPASSEAVPTLEAAKKEKVATPAPIKPQLTEREQVAKRIKPSFKPKPPSRFKSSKIAALIDKSVKKEQETLKNEEEKTKFEVPDAKKPLFTDLKSRLAIAALQDAITSQMYSCWSIPSGVKDVHTMQVMIRVQLRPDGSLLRQPQFVGDVDLNGAGQEGFRTFAESARRAVQSCAPYERLPAERYEEWKDIEFNFDASEMTG